MGERNAEEQETLIPSHLQCSLSHIMNYDSDMLLAEETKNLLANNNQSTLLLGLVTLQHHLQTNERRPFRLKDVWVKFVTILLV